MGLDACMRGLDGGLRTYCTRGCACSGNRCTGSHSTAGTPALMLAGSTQSVVGGVGAGDIERTAFSMARRRSCTPGPGSPCWAHS